MAHSRGFPRRAQSQRRRTAWTEGVNQDPINVTGAGKSLWTNGLVTSLENTTVVRTHGFLHLQLDLATAAGDGMIGASGICVVTEDAFAVGVTAVPSAYDDMSWDGWLWHQLWSVRGVAAQSIGADVARNASADLFFKIDSKAIRCRT